MYYCESCSVAVKCSNREEHELSSQHIDSVKNDKLLKQLHDLYVNIDGEEYDNTATSVKNIKTNSETVLNVTDADISNLTFNDYNQVGPKPITYADAVTTFGSKSDINVENHRSFDQKTDKDGNKNIINNVENKNDDTNVNTYGDIIMARKRKENRNSKHIVINREGRTMHYLKHIINNTVEIESLSGAKAIVPLDNYHGFSKSGGNINCKVCMKMVKDKDVHMYEKEHLDNIKRPIEDENFYRQVSLYHGPITHEYC